MGIQRNRPQMKVQEKPPKKDVNEIKAGYGSNIQFKVIVIRMLNRMEKDIETIKKNQSEVKTTVSEMKNTLEGINSRLDEERNE